MLKTELDAAVRAAKEETRTALQTVYDELNHGQKQKILKVESVRVLFERYGVET